MIDPTQPLPPGEANAGPLAIAVLISGGGTTLKNLIARKNEGNLLVDFRLVISSAADAAGLQYAWEAGITTDVLSRKTFDHAVDHSQAIFSKCRECEVDVVVMAGYLEHLLIPEDFRNRVINIHPSLIPAFSGKGYYGMRVHRAVLEYGAKISGCTVHFVDNEFDHGPIIAQRAVDVLSEDTPESLQARIFEQECLLLPEVINAIARKKVSVEGRTIVVQA